MPQQNKATWARLRVGILAIVAMGVVALVIILITGNTNLFEKQAHIYTYFADAASLNQGAAVNLNGIAIGQIKNVSLSGSRDPQRAVKVDMEIPASKLRDIPVDSQAAISAANLLGSKFINITMGMSTTTVQPGQEVPSQNTAEFESLVKQGYSVLASLQAIVDRVGKIVGTVEAGEGTIGKLLVDNTLYNHILAIVDAVQQLANALDSKQGTIGQLIYSPDLYNQAQAEMMRIDSILQGLQAGNGTAGKLLKDPALYDELQKTVDQANQLVADLNAGKGTAGKLLKSDELNNQLVATMGKIDTLLDKMNSGQGTIGQLLVNPQLYDNLTGATSEMQGLMKDFRANPKKFLRIKLSFF